ncbi:histidine-type phosphatase [Aquabacter cavernae]|uniref:histidine-type phosphatase n=1 Tax=Aquabacter cavernae TaxID=2496029 RepID=UPI000F8D0A64|nr:histidine-type phosphatase [Aquabacter cavernae]
MPLMSSRPSVPARLRRMLLPLACALLPFGVATVPAGAETVLERVVLVQRHGVRAPTQSLETLDAWSARGWPVWPVARGYLTDKGAQVVALIADGIRAHYAARGLLAGGCANGAVQVWADGRDERTRHSGAQMAAHLAPGCGLSVQSGPHGARDPLFESIGGACWLQPDEGAQALRAALGAGGTLADAASAKAIPQILTILKPGSPTPSVGADGFEVKPEGITITGPLSEAAQAGEIFLLEYAQGFPPGEVAWGEASDAARLGPLLAPRNRLSDLARSLPYLAVRQGAGMARLMLGVLALEPRAASPAIGAGARLVALAGHDDNLSNMAGVFGVNWTLPGQPDATAPATAFALERWRDTATGAISVGLTLFYAELDGMRSLDPKAVHALAVPLPGCGTGRCPLEPMRARILPELPAACGQ